MPRYIDADALIVQMQKNCLGCALHEKDPECRACAWGDAENVIDNAPTADEEKIATEYCMKRCLVMMTMDTYQQLIACYNRCAGL